RPNAPCRVETRPTRSGDSACFRGAPRRDLEAMLDDLARVIDHERQTAPPVEEREAVASRIAIDAALAAARDLSFPHEWLDEVHADAEAFGNQRCVHRERLAVEFDPAVLRVHGRLRVMTEFHHRAASGGAP